MLKDKNQIEAELREKITDLGLQLVNSIDQGTSDPNNFISLDEIESLLNSTVMDTKIQYLNSISHCLNSMDESSIIKLKKYNTPKRG